MYRVKHINTGLLLALLVIGGVSTWLLLDRVDRQLRSAERAAIDDRRCELDTLANALAYLIDFNEASIESLARDSDVIDLLEFADADAIVGWTTRQRRHIPMGFGLGIIDSSGRLIGDNRHQRVGLACLSDARQIFHGAATPRPLIHNDIDGLEHYDVMKPIEDAAGAVIGHLLASYRLGLFDAWLDRLYPQTAQQLIELRDGSGQVLSSRGRPPASDDTLVLGSSVPGTQLGLRMTVARPAPPPIYAELQWISAAAKLLTLAVFCGAWLALRRFPACAADAPIADLE